MAFNLHWFNSFVKLLYPYARELGDKNSEKGLMWHSELSMDNQRNTIFNLFLYLVIMSDCKSLAWSECKTLGFASE